MKRWYQGEEKKSGRRLYYRKEGGQILVIRQSGAGFTLSPDEAAEALERGPVVSCFAYQDIAEPTEAEQKAAQSAHVQACRVCLGFNEFWEHRWACWVEWKRRQDAAAKEGSEPDIWPGEKAEDPWETNRKNQKAG
jgi:hypothetical protein